MSALIFPRHPISSPHWESEGSPLTIQLPLAISNATPSVPSALSGSSGDRRPAHAAQPDNDRKLYTVRILRRLLEEEEKEGQEKPTRPHAHEVYMAVLKLVGTGPTDLEPGQIVVCKVSRERTSLERLFEEAKIYAGPLRTLQGDVVPEFFGLFSGDMDGGQIGVVVLKYHGTPLSETGEVFRAFSEKLRHQIYEGFTKIHQVGISHGDITERNVLCDRRGKIWIVDFEHASRKHGQCRLSRHRFKFNSNMVPSSEMDCTELRGLIEDLGAWVPLECHGYRITDLEKIPTLEELTKHSIEKGADPQTAGIQAYEFLRYHERWNKDRKAREKDAAEKDGFARSDDFMDEVEEDIGDEVDALGQGVERVL